MLVKKRVPQRVIQSYDKTIVLGMYRANLAIKKMAVLSLPPGNNEPVENHGDDEKRT